MNKKHLSSPIILAVLCAVWVHTVLFTDAWHRMQWAITETAIDKNTAESHLILTGDILTLVIEKDIQNVTKMTASLAYNEESLELIEGENSFGKIIKTPEESDQDITLISATPKNIKTGTPVIQWKIKRLLPEIHVINLSNVTFSTPEWEFYLSTRWTGEF